MRRKSRIPVWGKLLLAAIAVSTVLAAWTFGVNAYVVHTGKKQVVSAEQAAQLEDVDFVIVLGAGVRNGRPTPMLYDRIWTGTELYKKNPQMKLLMSGDHQTDDYDEITPMQQTAVELGVPEDAIGLDPAGLSTYESIYRAAKVFGAKKIVIVTQKYHLYRALYIARSLGMEAVGVSADTCAYYGQMTREVREIIARNKDVLFCAIHYVPKSPDLAVTLWP